MIRKIIYSMIGGLVALTMLSGLALRGAPVAADTEPLTITVNVNTACSLVIVGTNDNVATHSTTINPGNDGSIGSSTVQSICNDSSGLAVYAVGYTGDEYGENRLISTTNSALTIQTGASNSPTSSQWYMQLAPGVGAYAPTVVSEFQSKHVIPNVYTKVAYRNSATDAGSGATGAQFTANFRAYISPNQVSSTYAGKVKFLLVHPNVLAYDSQTGDPATYVASTMGEVITCPANKICYVKNGADVEGSMSSIGTCSITGGSVDCQGVSSNHSEAFNPPNYSRSGYGFASWNTEPDGSGVNYGPRELITTGDLSAMGMTVYANWVAPEEGITMQTFDPAAAPYATAPVGTVIGLKDVRDNTVYAVAKLADGKWWMIENLRFDPAHKSLNSANTNNPNPDFAITVLGIQNSDFSTCNYNDGRDCIDQYSVGMGNVTGSTSSRNNGDLSTRWFSYGAMYNWYTVTAGNGTYDVVGTSAMLAGDICPAGWHVPSGGNAAVIQNTGSEYWSLIRAIAGSDPDDYPSNVNYGVDVATLLRSYPNNYVLSGNYNSAGTQNRSNYAYYWTRTADNYNRLQAFNLQFNSNTVYPGSINYFRSYGRAVRCLAGS